MWPGQRTDRWDTHSTFIDRAFRPRNGPADSKKISVRPAKAIIKRSIIRGEDHNGLIVEPQFPDQGQDLANVTIHAGDHGGIGGPGRAMRQVIPIAPVRFLRKLANVLGERIFWNLQCQVRNGCWIVQEERPGLCFGE